MFYKKNGLLHEGFQEVYLSIRNDIIKKIESIKKSKKIYITGHSLGATLATLACIDIEYTLKKKITALYTFASPRVGDNDFVKAFNNSFSKKTYRIANCSDIVTEIPFPAMIMNVFGGYFSHVDSPIVFTIQENDIEKNHDISTYINALKEEQRNIVRKIIEIFV